ncbi:MAG: hypothetical protein U5L09_15135 [Bacteroidales bacterium]|nr:hypothetical protein [Bacteroidales bacterium]
MNADESFTMSYTDNFYNYTLYYYNQAGNLNKTIPPKGFSPLSKSKVDKVQQNRNNNGNNSLSPNHKMATKYTYNSHNMVVKEDSPDKGVTKFWYNVMGRTTKRDSEQKSRGNVSLYSFMILLNGK